MSTDDLQVLAVRSDGTPFGTSVTLDGAPILDVVRLELDIDATQDVLVTARITLECRLDIETAATVSTK